jgi:hypothetical protein
MCNYECKILLFDYNPKTRFPNLILVKKLVNNLIANNFDNQKISFLSALFFRNRFFYKMKFKIKLKIKEKMEKKLFLLKSKEFFLHTIKPTK